VRRLRAWAASASRPALTSQRGDYRFSQFISIREDITCIDLRQKCHATSEHGSPNKLNCDGESIGTGVVTVLSGIVDDSCNKEAYGDSPLVSGHDCSSDPFRGTVKGFVNIGIIRARERPKQTILIDTWG
jgi:hypothetical protein